MIQWEKTYLNQKTKELNDLIDIAVKATGKTREEVIVRRDARFMEAPWEGKNNEQTTKG